MKKLLSILAAVGLTATASTAVVACSDVDMTTNSNFNLVSGQVNYSVKLGLHTTDKNGNDLNADGGVDLTTKFTLKEGYKSVTPSDLSVKFVADSKTPVADAAPKDGGTQTYTLKGTLTVVFTPVDGSDVDGNTDEGQVGFQVYKLQGTSVNKDVVESIDFNVSKSNVTFNKVDDKTLVFDQDGIDTANYPKVKGDATPVKGEADKDGNIDVKAELATGVTIQVKQSDGSYKDQTVTIDKAFIGKYGTGKKATDNELQVVLHDALKSGDYQLVISNNSIFTDAKIQFSVK